MAIIVPGTRSRPLGAPQIRTPRIDNSGLEQLGQGVQRLGIAATKIATEAKDRSDTAAVTDALTDLQNDFTTVLWDPEKGALHTKGKDAYGADAKAKTELQKAIQARRGLLANGAQQELYDKKAEAMFSSAYRSLEQHVGAQRRVAETATLKAGVATTLDAVSKNYANPAERERLVAAMEEPIKKLAASEEAGEQTYQELRQSAAKVVLNRYISSHDYKGAEAYFAQVKDLLGTDTANFEHDIGLLKRQQSATTFVSTAIESTRQKDTKWVDEDRVRAIVRDTEFQDPEVRKAVLKEMEIQLRAEKQLIDADISDHWTRDLAMFNAGNHRVSAVPTNEQRWLNTHAPELYSRLQNEEYRRLQIARTNAAEGRRAQNETDRIAIQNFMALDTQARANANVDRMFGGTGVSDLGIATIRTKKREAGDIITRGLASSESEFTRAMMERAVGTVTGKEDLKDLKAAANKIYTDMLRDLKRPPTVQEQEKAIEQALSTYPTQDSVFGFSYTTQKYGYQLYPDVPDVDPTSTPPEVDENGQTYRVPKPVRMQQLIQQGLDSTSIKAQLDKEGY